MATTDNRLEFKSLLEELGRNQTDTDVALKLNSLADILEKEKEKFNNFFPEGIDHRDQGSYLGLDQRMKTMVLNEVPAEFLNKLVGEYIMSGHEFEQLPLHTASCRLLLDLLPGLETSILFRETEGLVARLISWAETAEDPLRSYATGLLGSAMEIRGIAAHFMKQNTRLVPLMLQRLHKLRSLQERKKKSAKKVLLDSIEGHFGSVSEKENGEPAVEEITDESMGIRESRSKCRTSEAITDGKTPTKNDTRVFSVLSNPAMTPSSENTSNHLNLKRSLSPGLAVECHVTAKQSRTRDESFGECSNSSSVQMVQLVSSSDSLKPPLPTTMKQRLILQYLTPMGGYKKLLSCVFEHHSMDLIFYYMNWMENSEMKLAFEAYEYLETLRRHKQFNTEFRSHGGEKLITKFVQVIVARRQATEAGVSRETLSKNAKINDRN